jgi:transketolase
MVGALDAQKFLKRRHLSKRNQYSPIKPIDKEAINKEAKKTHAVVTAETLISSMDLACSCKVLVENYPHHGTCWCMDHFGEVGKKRLLNEKFGLKAQNIVEACKRVRKERKFRRC